MPAEIYLNVAVNGLLTGLVYGLMALGLSVIFGVVRVVNFAHGEMMTLAMYATVVAFASLRARPVPDAGAGGSRAVRARLPAAGRHHQSVHQPARAQPVHAAGGGGDHPRQRPAHRVRSRCPQRPDLLLVRQLPDRQADRRRQQGLCGRDRRADRRRAVRLLPLHDRSARRSAPAPTTMPARWWSAST